jgi:hypothetical protein
MKEFGIEDFKELCDLLIAKRVMPAPDAEAFAHALMDMRESTVEIYDEFLPKLIEYLRTDTGDVEDMIWNIRESCRHIDYHLKDAKLVPGA